LVKSDGGCGRRRRRASSSKFKQVQAS